MSINNNTNVRVKSFLDASNFSDPKDAVDLFYNKVRQSVSYDAFGGKTDFPAVVLSRPVPMSHEDLQSYRRGNPEEVGTTNFAEKRGYMFRARIVDDPSPHWIIPNPCDQSLAANEAQSLIAMHTKFIMMIDDMGTIPRVGDMVMVKLEKNVFSYNLTTGEALRKIDSSRGPRSIGACHTQECKGFTRPDQAGPAPSGARVPTPTSEVYESTPAFVTGDPSEPPAITTMRAKGYEILEDGRINIVSTRASYPPTGPAVPDQFNDRMQIIWFDSGQWYVKNFQITTVPGVKLLSNPWWHGGSTKGTAVMFPGQYKDVYVWGNHRSKYSTVRQRGKVKYWRDADANDVAGDSGITAFKNPGLNLHPAAKAKTSKPGGKWAHRHGPPAPVINVLASGRTYRGKGARKVHSWSGGCQVFKYYDQWGEAMQFWNDATISKGQKAFTYTLLPDPDLPSGGITSLDEDAQNRVAGTLGIAAAKPAEPTDWGEEGVDWEWTEEPTGDYADPDGRDSSG